MAAPIIAVLAGYFDFTTTRIPNWLTISGILLGLVKAAITGNILFSLLGIMVSLIFVPFVIKGQVGAGDFKFAAALGALGGPIYAMQALLIGSLLGGIAALLITIHKKYEIRCLKKFSELSLTEEGMMPYGVYIALGALGGMLL